MEDDVDEKAVRGCNQAHGQNAPLESPVATQRSAATAEQSAEPEAVRGQCRLAPGTGRLGVLGDKNWQLGVG